MNFEQLKVDRSLLMQLNGDRLPQVGTLVQVGEHRYHCGEVMDFGRTIHLIPRSGGSPIRDPLGAWLRLERILENIDSQLAELRSQLLRSQLRT